MIGLPAGTPIWLAAGVTDMRSGFNGLASKLQTALEEDPYSGRVFVFQGRRGDLIRVLWWTGDGLCLLCKRLEKGRFIWPQATRGTVTLTCAQLSMLLRLLQKWRLAKKPNASRCHRICRVKNGCKCQPAMPVRTAAAT